MKKLNKLKAHRTAKRVIGKVDASLKGPSNARTYIDEDSDDERQENSSVIISKPVEETSIADVKDAPPVGAKKDWINLHTVINPEITSISDTLSKTQKRRISKKNRVLIKRGLVTNPLENRRRLEAEGPVAKAQLRDFSELECGIMQQAAATSQAGTGTNGSGSGSSAVNIKAAAAVPTLTNKMKKTVALREVERMKLVQAHPMYQANPLDAIKAHLAHMNSVREQNNASANAAQAAMEAEAAESERRAKVSQQSAAASMSGAGSASQLLSSGKKRGGKGGKNKGKKASGDMEY